MDTNVNTCLFEESNSDVLSELLESCANEICGYPGPTYQQFANNINWTEDDYNSAYQLFSRLLRNPTALYLEKDQMPQEYFELPDQVQNKVISCLRVRRDQLSCALLKEYSKKRAPTMTEFDWRLQLVMGSSKLASLKQSLLELDLVVNDSRIVSLEMNSDEVDSLISVLETIAR